MDGAAPTHTVDDAPAREGEPDGPDYLAPGKELSCHSPRTLSSPSGTREVNSPQPTSTRFDSSSSPDGQSTLRASSVLTTTRPRSTTTASPSNDFRSTEPVTRWSTSTPRSPASTRGPTVLARGVAVQSLPNASKRSPTLDTASRAQSRPRFRPETEDGRDLLRQRRRRSSASATEDPALYEHSDTWRLVGDELITGHQRTCGVEHGASYQAAGRYEEGSAGARLSPPLVAV